jgi:hypothetical protein
MEPRGPAASRASARRGAAGVARRGPQWAHAVTVGAARRLRCGARSGIAPQNSLRSLRSLRSDSRGESVVDARCARRSRRLRSAPSQKSPSAGPCTQGRPRCHRMGYCAEYHPYSLVRRHTATCQHAHA